MAAFVEGRKMDIKVVSAENLRDVRRYGRMKVYAVVSLNGSTQRSVTDRKGKTNPTWNFVAGYTVAETAVKLPGVKISVELWCQRSLGDRLIGEVKIGVKNLFESPYNKILRCRVEGTSQGEGVLNISCNFGPKIAVELTRRPHAARAPTSSLSSGMTVLNTALGVAKFGLLAAGLFNGADDQDNDDGDDDEDIGGSFNDDNLDDDDGGGSFMVTQEDI